jgi:uncharacterized protein GlcG (DUF336 family)
VADATPFDVPYGMPIKLETAKKHVGAVGCSGGTGDQHAAAGKAGAESVR